ncbi:MAG: GDSL-type esterase/lipase family protein [Candidatus Omnitrophota bacterium]
MLLVLALFLLEIMLRLGGVLYFQFKYPSKPVKVDSNGFNMLCLGDSFTQGFGAPHGKSYPEQLQELMKGQTNKNIIAYKEFRINSSTILKNLEKDIHTYHPDLIIIMTGCNDLWNMENATDSAFGEDDLLGKIDIALSGSRVYKLIKISYLNLSALAAGKYPKLINEENSKKKFSTSEAEKHFSLGEQHFHSGERELALNEFNIAEGLEPQNPWVHWRKACIYIQAMHETSLGENELKLTVWHGDSSVLEYAFMLLSQLYEGDSEKIQAMIKEMEAIIDARYNGKEKVKAKKILKRLSLLRNDQKTLEKVVAYNLKEIIETIKGKNIKVILMNYPDEVAPRIRSVVERAGMLSSALVIDNHQTFKDKLKTLRQEDLFAADGHCNANGYKLIAENLQQALIKERMLDDVGNG